MYRNAGNATASVSADGNYQELDAGSGLSNTIRFNIVDPVNSRPITVLSNGMLAERPEGSLRAEIETLAGQNDSIIETLAVVAGVPTTNFRSAPNSVDLQTFGQRVLTMETNRARIDLSNTWTAYQAFLGRTDGAAIPSGYIGEKINGTLSLATIAVSGSSYNSGSMALPIGKWMVYSRTRMTPGGTTHTLSLSGISLTTGVLDHPFFVSDFGTEIINSRYQMAWAYYDLVAPTTVYQVVSANFTGTAPTVPTAQGIFFAIRQS
jgi:hypothetical protein